MHQLFDVFKEALRWKARLCNGTTAVDILPHIEWLKIPAVLLWFNYLAKTYLIIGVYVVYTLAFEMCRSFVPPYPRVRFPISLGQETK